MLLVSAYKAGFWAFGLLDGRVVGPGSIFGLSAFSFRFGTERSFYYKIDTLTQLRVHPLLPPIEFLQQLCMKYLSLSICKFTFIQGSQIIAFL